MSPNAPLRSTTLADQVLAVDVFSELLASTDPQQLGRRLTEQLRELTGVRTVVLMAHPEAGAPHTLIHVCPERRTSLFGTEELGLFCPDCSPEALPTLTAQLSPDHPLRVVLQRAGVESLLRVPLRVQGAIVATLLLLDFPEPGRSQEAATIVAHLAPVIALALKNAFAQARVTQQAQALQDQTRELEQRVAERTAALEATNKSFATSRLAALNLMEDAVAARQRLESANESLQREIAERKRTEESLRQTQQRLDLAQRAAGAGIWDWDMATNRLEWSPELFALFGLDPARDQASLETWQQLIHPDDKAGATQRLTQAIERGTLLENEYRVIQPEGGIRWIFAIGRTTYDADRKPVRMAGICLDTTTRKTTEAALQHSEALFRSTFDEAPVGAAVVGLDQTFQRVNAALCRLLGFPAEELLRRTFPQVTHPDDIVDSVANVRRLLGGEVSAFEIEKRYLRADGEVVWGRVSVSLVRDSAGRPLHFLPIIQDITERKRTEQALQESEQRYATTLAAVNDGLWEWQVPSGNAYFSPGYYRMLGYADGAFVANYTNWRALVHPDDLERVEAELRHSVGSSHGFAIDLRMKTESGAWRWVSTRGNTIERDADGQVLRMAGTLSDITQRKQAEAELEQFFALVPDMVCIASGDGFFQKLNDEWVRVLGYSKAELMAVPYAEFVHPDDRVTTIRESDRLATGASTSSFINRYRAKDGTYRWLEWNATATNEKGILFAAARDITEHRQAEQAVRESELRYRTLANSGQGLIWTAGLDKKCNYFNQTWLAFTGRRLEQELGDGWVEGVHPDDLQRCVATYTTAFDRRQRFSMDYRLRHHTGEYRWIQDDGSPRFDSEGNFLGYIGHCLDITERKQAAEIIAWEAALVDNSSDICCVKGLDLRVKAVNSAFVRAARANSASEVLGKTDAEISGWPGNEGNTESYLADERQAQTLAPGKSILREEQAMQPDGSVRHLLTRKFPVFDPTGRLIATASISTDITERRRAEDALHESEQHHRLLIQHLHAGVVVHAPDTRILLANEQASILLGLSIDQMLGKAAIDPAWCFLHEDGSPMPLDEYPVNRVRSSLEPVRNLVLGIHYPDTSRPVWVLINGFPDLDGEGALDQIVVTFVDITQRKYAEEALRESLREKEALLKEVHHRVKNNLQIISSLLRLQAGQIDHPATSAVLHDMQGRIRSMALLHETLYRSGNLAQVDLADYLQAVCTQSLRAAARRQAAAIRLEFDLATILVDATQAVPCGLLVNELVSNSIKHAFPGERGGTVRVSLHPAGDHGAVSPRNAPPGSGAGVPACDSPPHGGAGFTPAISVTPALPRSALRLTVSDNGVGLPPNFDLAQLHSLGLHLVSDLARQLQGTLEISASPGTGVTFTVTFAPPPLPATARRANEPEHPISGHPPGGGPPNAALGSADPSDATARPGMLQGDF